MGLKRHAAGLFFLAVILVLSGCSFQFERTAPDARNNPIFIPPTLVPTLIPTIEPTVIPVSVSSSTAEETITGNCSNVLTYVSDLTIPDGTVVEGGSTLDKRWEVDNNGTCNWGEGYQLRFIGGEEMGASAVQDLIPARSGTRVTIEIMFTAPTEAGTYRSAWQAYDPGGNPFGDPIYIVVVVE
jgi:hypothetical protein